MGITCSVGSQCNRIEPGKVNELFGDPKVKAEKPLTIIKFPGGDVEIARTEDGDYWVHVAVRKEIDTPEHKPGQIVGGRIDMAGPDYADDANAALNAALEGGDVEHLAFLIRPGGK